MSALFLKIVNMSIAASWLVLAVLLLRLVLKKAPKWVSVLLWGFVAVRLILPFSFASVLSLIPSAETVSPGIMMDRTPEIATGIQALDQAVNPIITESFAPELGASANPLQILIPLAAALWLAGIVVMLIYTAVSYFLLRRKVATAVLLRDNIFQTEYAGSSFVLGIIKPRIYLPFQMNPQNLEHVIAHEESHIRRKDHWWKPLGFLLLALHWFNPLIWLGYILLCRDIELACDEKVIQKMDSDTRADYTQALVDCSIGRRSIAACPLAFGEVGVKGRVKSVMHYKKPAFWIIVAAIVICAAVAVCFLTDPATPTPTQPHFVQAVESDIMARSGEHSVPMVSLPAGTPIADYVSAIHWLTIAPSEDDAFGPFTALQDGQTLIGSYSAFDAQTFQPLDYWIPSGLEPQTYLFQHADPSREYIVLAVFSDEPGSTIYAFGARFDPATQLSFLPINGPVDRVTLTDLSGKTTQITEPADVEAIVSFLRNIVGEPLGSTKGWYGGDYIVKLMNGDNEVLSAVFVDAGAGAEDSLGWFYYGYVEGENYPVRYGYLTTAPGEMMNFFGKYLIADELQSFQ